jgi:hypothetical protein
VSRNVANWNTLLSARPSGMEHPTLSVLADFDR